MISPIKLLFFFQMYWVICGYSNTFIIFIQIMVNTQTVVAISQPFWRFCATATRTIVCECSSLEYWSKLLSRWSQYAANNRHPWSNYSTTPITTNPKHKDIFFHMTTITIPAMHARNCIYCEIMNCFNICTPRTIISLL